MEAVRICKKCGETKLLTAFSKHSSGRRHECYKCTRSYMKAWQAAHPESEPARIKKKAATRYGLSPDQYEEMLSRQDGGCAICGRSYSNRRLNVDHDHVTGVVRELLCSRCNTDLAVLENAELLPLLQAYLAKHNPSLDSTYSTVS